MKWTKEAPMVPGAYWWRTGDDSREIVIEVSKHPTSKMLWAFGLGTTAEQLGGEWFRLVPADEVQKAWVESRQSVGCFGECDAITNGDHWANSRAKRVAEGREEPTST